MGFSDDFAFDDNLVYLPEAPGNKEAVLMLAPVLKRAITAGMSLEVKARQA